MSRVNTGLELEWVKPSTTCLIFTSLSPTFTENETRVAGSNMLTSSNENIFRVTGHLCGEFTGDQWVPPQRPMTPSFDIFVDLCLNIPLTKHSWGWGFETSSHSKLTLYFSFVTLFRCSYVYCHLANDTFISDRHYRSLAPVNLKVIQQHV